MILNFEKINEELKLYNNSLAERPQIVAANKTDIIQDESLLEEFRAYIKEKGLRLFEISAAAHIGTKELINYVAEVLDTLEPVEIYEADFEEENFEEEPFTVYKDGETYVVEGPYIEKLLRHCNFEDGESLQYFQVALRRKGVIEALENAGFASVEYRLFSGGICTFYLATK